MTEATNNNKDTDDESQRQKEDLESDCDEEGLQRHYDGVGLVTSILASAQARAGTR